MEEKTNNSSVDDSKSMWKWILSSAFVSSLCCVPSIVLVMLGISTTTAAAALSDRLYWGIARPILYAISIAMLSAGLWIYFRRQNICTLDDVKRNRNRIINTILIVFILSYVIYFVWNYIILEIIGLAIDIDEWKETAIWNRF